MGKLKDNEDLNKLNFMKMRRCILYVTENVLTNPFFLSGVSYIICKAVYTLFYSFSLFYIMPNIRATTIYDCALQIANSTSTERLAFFSRTKFEQHIGQQTRL